MVVFRVSEKTDLYSVDIPRGYGRSPNRASQHIIQRALILRPKPLEFR